MQASVSEVVRLVPEYTAPYCPQPVNLLHDFAHSFPDVPKSPTDEALTSAGYMVSHYLLAPSFPSGSNRRFAFDAKSGVTLRKMLAEHAVIATDMPGCEDVASPLPVFRPCLVARTANGLNPASPFRARVSLDLDPVEDHKFPDRILDHAFVDAFFALLGKWWDTDLSAESFVLFAGSFPDKLASAHLHFTDLSWEPTERSKDVPQEALVQINALLLPYNLKLDKAPFSAGLKYPFMDKDLRNGKGWRGRVMRPLILRGLRAPSYELLFTVCDPIVWIGFDRACDRTVTWKQVAQAFPPRSPRRARTVTVQFDQDPAPGERNHADRIRTWIPQWETARFRVINKPEYEIYVPDSKFCPLKQEDHDNTGVCKVHVFHDGKMQLKCFKADCAGNVRTLRAPIPDKPMEDDERTVINWMNARFAVCAIRGSETGVNNTQQLIISIPQSYEEPICSYKVADLKLKLQNKFIVRNIGVRVRKLKEFTYLDLWLKSSERREFIGVDSNPGGSKPGFYNIWRGFDERLLAKSEQLAEFDEDYCALKCQPFLRHIRYIICQGNEDQYEYVLNWCAWLYQTSEKPDAALVIHGNQGLGKTLFTRYLSAVVGEWHSKTVSTEDSVIGKFNPMIQNRRLLVLDEATGKLLRQNPGQLNELITSPTVELELKYFNRVTVPSYHAIVIVTNKESAVPTIGGARRFAMFDANTHPEIPNLQVHLTVVGDALDDGSGPAAFHAMCVKRNISGWHPRRIVVSNALVRTQLDNLDLIAKWWFHCLRQEYILDNAGEHLLYVDGADAGGVGCWGNYVPKDCFGISAERFNSRLREGEVWSYLYKYFKKDSIVQETFAGNVRKRVVPVGTLVEMKERFQEVHNLDPLIWTDVSTQSQVD